MRARGLFVVLTLFIGATSLSAGVADAGKPAWAGHHEKEEHGRGRESHREGGGRFGDREARIVRDYYGHSMQGGHCPPGLAKKRNGCLPPGQAKKWARGAPLPAGIVYYDLPPALVVELGRPPAGYKYVRVAADILMIAVGTSVVVDAIEDLGRM